MSSRTENFLIEVSQPGVRLDAYLRGRYSAVSRGALQRLIEAGHIKVNEHKVKATYSPKGGDKVEVYWPEAKPSEALPEDMPLEILFEDESLLVVNKPAGLVVHPAAGHEEHTLVNALLHHCAGTLSGIGGVARPGIVHRLDKETSGCLVVAKNDATHVALSEQFAARSVGKIYYAIVCGQLPQESGEIHAAIARHPTHRKRMAVHDDETGRAAHTSYRRLELLNSATLVEARIHTGRTHQVRVHLQFLGYPVAGDETYGARQNKTLRELTGFVAPRVMLHSRELTIVHPVTGKTLVATAPFPEDFQKALRTLQLAKATPLKPRKKKK